MSNKIFISIASYRDPALLQTINSAISNADNPEDLYFGVVIQELPKETPDLSHIKNMSVITMHSKDAMGVGYARDLAISLFKDQDYFLQIDSHTIFEKSWDTIAIDQLKKAQSMSNNKKIILSYFPPPFYIEDNKTISIITNSKEQLPYPTRQHIMLNNKEQWTAKRVPFENIKMEMPELSTTVLAGFIFAESDLIKEVPYDPEISFFGEEVCFAMRAWTRGWDIYSPAKIIVYHFYFRANYKKIWKDKGRRAVSWEELEKISKEKQKNVLCGIESGIFGAGNKRSLEQYESFAGINFKRYYGLT